MGLSFILAAAQGAGSIDNLWKAYDKAASADKPAEQVQILEQIKAQAKKEKRAWDFYDACEKSVTVSTRINWKQHDSLRKAMTRDLEAYGEPVLLFYHNRNAKPDKDFIKANRKGLQASKNPEFWKNDYRISGYSYRDALIENFGNDLDYACWVAEEDNFQGRYPLSALFEFSRIESEDTQALMSYRDKYAGKAVSLLAGGLLLQNRWYSLLSSGGSSDEFLALKADCNRFNNDRKSFKNGEKTIAQCCTMADALLDDLNAENLSADISDGVLSIAFQNIKSAKVEILDGKKAVFSKVIDNTVQSFRKMDTVKFTLPVIDDGDYNFICSSGKNKVESEYRKHTLSIATRRDVEGCHAFVADYMTGKPVDGRGFFPIAAGTKEYTHSFRDKEGVLHSTEKVRVNTDPLTVDLRDKGTIKCSILTDRAFYSPDDTVHFKAVFYNGTYTLRNSGAGLQVKASLRDTEGSVIDEEILTTNEFGSVAGEFKAARSGRNGMYMLIVEAEGDRWTEWIKVDDVVLPEFEVIFEGGAQENLETIPDTIRVKGKAASYSGHPLSSARISYSVTHNWGAKPLCEGTLMPDPNGNFRIEFPSVKPTSAYYYEDYNVSIKVVDATGETHEFNKSLFCSRKGTEPKPTSYYFEDLEKNGLSCRIVAGDKPVWATVTLFGPGNVILEDKLIHFEPVNGVASTTVSYVYQESYPEVVKMFIDYFQNGRRYTFSTAASRENKTWDLPVSFSRFHDTTRPGMEYTFGISTEPGVECAVTIYDKSTEKINSSKWYAVTPNPIPCPYPYYDCTTGQNRTVMVYINKSRGFAMAAKATLQNDSMEVVEEEAIPFKIVQENGDVYLRENFANTIAWEPFLYSDANGNVSFTFRNADKLSTYYVQVFAHNKAMQSGVARREMMVTIPVKVAVAQPRFLYEGDRYVARATVSNSTDRDVTGRVIFNDAKAVKVAVPAHGQTVATCTMDTECIVDLPLKVVFLSDNDEDGSDGIRLSVPILKPFQTITEAHSSLLFSGEDRDALISRLRGEFIMASGAEATVREISILDMINEALPKEVEPEHDDVLSLSKALLSRMLLQRPPICNNAVNLPDNGTTDDELIRKIEACRNSDGGYAWYKGMTSSPILTAVLLERLKGVLPDVETSVKYLDKQFFTEKAPFWRGWLTLEQYLHVRSQYSQVAFSEKTDAAFRKSVKSYLVPGKERGLEGLIFHKARRIEILRSLMANEDGIRLAKQWGIGLFTASRLDKSERSDMESLSQYAVKHPSGGVYFPNAVMPWRGLLESELYAHNLLSRIFDGRDDSISNGIRLWTMIQKETQKWENDPAYIEAVQNVLKAPENILNTEVIALKGTFTEPFSSIKATGNGFSIKAESVREGHIGDKVTVKYTVHNDENRSFVKFTLPFPAGLMPVKQESGLNGWNCYRNVLKDRIEYWFDSYPEETTTIKEEFYISQEGEFQCPVPTVECLYADHYRANGAANELLKTTE